MGQYKVAIWLLNSKFTNTCGSTFTTQHTMSCKKRDFINNHHKNGKDDSKALIRSMSWCASWTYIVTFNWRPDGISCCCWDQLRRLRNLSKRILDTRATNIFRCKCIWPKRIPILEFILVAKLCKKQKEKSVIISNALCKWNKKLLPTWYYKFYVLV